MKYLPQLLEAISADASISDISGSIEWWAERSREEDFVAWMLTPDEEGNRPNLPCIIIPFPCPDTDEGETELQLNVFCLLLCTNLARENSKQLISVAEKGTPDFVSFVKSRLFATLSDLRYS